MPHDQLSHTCNCWAGMHGLLCKANQVEAGCMHRHVQLQGHWPNKTTCEPVGIGLHTLVCSFNWLLRLLSWSIEHSVFIPIHLPLIPPIPYPILDPNLLNTKETASTHLKAQERRPAAPSSSPESWQLLDSFPQRNCFWWSAWCAAPCMPAAWSAWSAACQLLCHRWCAGCRTFSTNQKWAPAQAICFCMTSRATVVNKSQHRMQESCLPQSECDPKQQP